MGNFHCEPVDAAQCNDKKGCGSNEECFHCKNDDLGDTIYCAELAESFHDIYVNKILPPVLIALALYLLLLLLYRRNLAIICRCAVTTNCCSRCMGVCILLLNALGFVLLIVGGSVLSKSCPDYPKSYYTISPCAATYMIVWVVPAVIILLATSCCLLAWCSHAKNYRDAADGEYQRAFDDHSYFPSVPLSSQPHRPSLSQPVAALPAGQFYMAAPPGAPYPYAVAVAQPEQQQQPACDELQGRQVQLQQLSMRQPAVTLTDTV